MNRNLWITLITAISILAGYEAFLRIARPHADTGQDQFATNRIRLENYVGQDKKIETVVVGSSLSARVPADAWPKGWYILSQAGGNALVGMEAIARLPQKPQKVMVEINTLDTSYKLDDVQAAFDPFIAAVRRILWLSRTSSRPSNLLVWRMRPADGRDNEQAGQGFSAQLAAWQASYDREPGQPLSQNLAHAKAIISDLRRAGVAIVFFEIPVDRSLMDRSRARRIRSAVSDTFATGGYCLISADAGNQWQTIDGIHLVRQDARRAAAAISFGSCGSSRNP